MNTISLNIPTKCPSCGSDLKFDGIHLVCPNEDCIGRKKAKFVDGVKILNILGIGEKMCEQLVDNGLRSPIDLFDTNKFSPTKLQEIWDKNYQKVYDRISKVEHISLEGVLMMGDFQGMGKTTAKEVAKMVAGVEYSFFGLQKSVVEGFSKGENKREKLDNIIETLNECGVKVDFPTITTSASMNAVGVECTGSPKPLFSTKEEFFKVIGNKGFIHQALKDAKILVTDSHESSSKMNTAKKKGLEILTYEEFIDKYVK